MTTKKHKVSAYLTDDEFEVLKGLANQYQVSQSQIVILAIRELAKLGQVELMELPVSYLPNAISGVTKEDMELLVKNEVKTAITELQTNFENQLGEFKSLVFETAPTLDGMNAAIAPLVKRIESLENANRNYPDLKEKINSINSLETAIKSNSESGVTKVLLETVTEDKTEKKTLTEIMPTENAPVSLETDNQDKTPIEDIKEPEMMVNPLLDGFPVISESECPFEVGRKYTQDELKALFSAKYGSDIINWIEKGVKSRNPLAQKYSHCFTFEGEGKTKLYTFNGL